MDKNASTGLILIMGIMLVWYLFFLPKTTPEPTTPVTSSTQTTQNDTNTIAPAVVANDTLRDKKMAEMYGDLSVATQGENKTFSIKTEKLTVHIESKGGKIANASLNEQKNFDGKVMSMVADVPPAQFSEAFSFQNRNISTADLFFQPVGNVPTSVSGKDSAKLTLRASIDANRFIEKSYTFKGDKYDVRYNYNMVGLDGDLKNNTYNVDWKATLPRQEKEVKNQRLKTTVVYKSARGSRKTVYDGGREKKKKS